MTNQILLTNGLDAAGAKIEVLLQDGVISKINRRPETSLIPHLMSEKPNAEVVDLDGRTLAPSLVDLHTHLREPGKEDAETVESGSRAAVRGGFGAISAMPNTNPIADTAGVVEQVMALGAKSGLCDVFPIGAVTVGQRGERLAEILAMANSQAKVRVFSDDGHCVSDATLMRRALEYVKIFDGVVAQHAQEPSLTIDAQMNEGAISARLGLRGWPAVAEEAIIARDVLLNDHVQSRLHICHVSTAGSVEIIRWAKSRGFQVTAEVTPHHLLLSDELAESFDPVYKVNPPLRNKKDVEALREGVADGTIDIIATDHAPHPTEDKECEWASATFGMLGLETALAVSFRALVETGMLTLAQLIEKMSTTPARIAGYENHIQGLVEGAQAHLLIFDPDKKWTVERSQGLSKSQNTPFHGMELGCYVHDVMYRGQWVLREGTVLK